MRDNLTWNQAIAIIAIMCAFYLALDGKDGWGWMLFLAFCLL